MSVEVIERRMLFAGIGVRLTDDHTGGLPVGKVRLLLDIADGASWRPLDVQPVRTPSGNAVYPALGRCADARVAPTRDYRVRVEAELYTPRYLANANGDGVHFTVHPYDDETPPQQLPNAPVVIPLLPGPAYPFEADVRVLRGSVVDSSNRPVAHALVESSLDRVLSGPDGLFALPLRWALRVGAASVDVSARSGPTRSFTVTLPDALGQRPIFQLS